MAALAERRRVRHSVEVLAQDVASKSSDMVGSGGLDHQGVPWCRGTSTGDTFACAEDDYTDGDPCGSPPAPFNCGKETGEFVCHGQEESFTCSDDFKCNATILYDCMEFKCTGAQEYTCASTVMDFHCHEFDCVDEFTCDGGHMFKCLHRFNCQSQHSATPGGTECTGENPYRVTGGNPKLPHLACSDGMTHTFCDDRAIHACVADQQHTCEPSATHDPHTIDPVHDCQFVNKHAYCHPDPGDFACAVGHTAGTGCLITGPKEGTLHTCESGFECDTSSGSTYQLHRPLDGIDVKPGDAQCGMPDTGVGDHSCSAVFACSAEDDFDCYKKFMCNDFDCDAGDQFACFVGEFDCTQDFDCGGQNSSTGFVCVSTFAVPGDCPTAGFDCTSKHGF